jgi:hypothetical protein
MSGGTSKLPASIPLGSIRFGPTTAPTDVATRTAAMARGAGRPGSSSAAA